MKILLSAYACEAGRGSEPGVGWNTAWELAKYHEVWVLTRPDDGRPAIEEFLAKNPNPNLHLVYFTLPIGGGLWKLGSAAFVLHYYLWQVQAYFVASKLHQEIGFDLAHHITFVRYSTPSFISFLPIPFIWGPVGGGEMAPSSFWKNFSLRARVYEILRALAHRIGELDPFARITAQRSALIRVTTGDTAKRVQKMGGTKIEIMPEASLSQEDLDQLSQCPMPIDSTLRFISMGRLLHWKGFHLGLQAFAKADLPDTEYWIVGEGVEEQSLQNLVDEFGIRHKVKFFGKLSRQETLKRLGECHVLVHPSLHDSGGWVCLEGMAAGRPILCLDLGGPGVQVTSETGIKVPPHHPEQVINDLAAAMTKLVQSPELRMSMSESGKTLIRKSYTWEAKGRSLAKLYEDLINQPHHS